MSRSRLIPLAVALALPVANIAGAASISATLSQKASASVRASTSGCSNNPGPYITLDGELKLSGVNARIILTNNARFTHVASTDVVADVVILPAGQSIKIAKQPSQGGVGGNPWIYLQFKDDGNRELGRAIRLGRCVQGLSTANLDFPLPTNVSCRVTSGQCSNNPGPYVTLDGELRMGGLNATLILTNNAKFTHATSADVAIDVVLIPAGNSITFSKQPSLGGADGNPWIYVQFLGGSGEKLSSPILVGRCVQSF
jgi:hypothetical protein